MQRGEEPVDTEMRDKLYEEIQQIEVIDTHEHVINREMLGNIGFNLFSALEFDYLKDDLLAVGMDENLLVDKAGDPDSLIDELIPLLRLTQNTSYYRAFFQALRDLHGMSGDCLDPANLKAASDSIHAAYEQDDWYSRVIRDRCKIKYMLRDMDYMPTEDDFIKPVIRMDNYFILRHKELLQEWIDKERILSMRIADAEYEARVRSLDDYLDIIENDFLKAIDFGAVGIKIAMAYRRTLQFDKVSIDDANRAFKLPNEKTTWADMKAFQDFIMHRIMENAAKYDLPVQIHTGLLAAGKNVLANTNPLHLTNIFLEFPHVKFDIFHGGFPFMGEIGAQALMFPNVYLDTCWLPLISYESFKNALNEWLSHVPAGKILWGGDCSCAEGAYGALYMVQHGLCDVLARKIQEGTFDEEYALEVARAILHDNASRLFNL